MLSALAKGIGLGVAAMYYFDPVVGRRRRSLLRDRIVASVHDVQGFIDRGMRDLTNRLDGFAAETRAALACEKVPDDVLAERVRSMMGRCVSHPGAIDVQVGDGRVILSGPILSGEVREFVTAVASVRGVEQVENRLDVRAEPDVASLQGGRLRPVASRSRLAENWSPARRLVATAAGVALMTNCLLRRTPGAVLLGTLGFGLFIRAAANEAAQQVVQERRLRRQQPREHAPQREEPMPTPQRHETAKT